MVGLYQKQGQSNYGRQPIDFHIYNIGVIGDLVDVSYKPYTERITEMLPDMWNDGKVYVSDVCSALGLTYTVLKKGLQRDNTNFEEIILKAKIQTIQDSLAKGQSIDEVCSLFRIKKKSKLNSLCMRFLGMTYGKLLKQKI